MPHRTSTDSKVSPSRRFARGDGSNIAYHASPGKSPGVVFLGGFMSDMTGTKAVALEAHCRAQARAFVRFDYQGHGASSGEFLDGTIGGWASDAIAVLDTLTEGPQVLVGSSMGGWIMLLAALARSDRVSSLLGIAPAPDFTEDLMWRGFDAETRDALLRDGMVELPSDYGDGPYLVARGLIEEARTHLLLRAPIALTCPVRLVQGMADDAVPWATSIRLAERLQSTDVTVSLIKHAGHRLSEPPELARITAALDGLTGATI